MKTFKFLFLALILFSITGVSAQTYCFTSPQGYGAGTTGGGSGSVTTVTSKSELEDALTASGSGVVLVKGSVQCDYLSVLVTNKTLLGLPGAKLYTNDQTSGKSGILYIKPGSKNVIIRNLIFVGPGAYDSDGRDCLTNEGTNVWIDHCEFQDGMDGNFDNKGKADDVTVSWCKFTYLKTPKSGGSGGTDDHRYSNLVGSSSSNYPSDKQYSITWQNCWWANGCVERMVRARNAELHMLNCYWNSSVAKKCIGLEDGSNGNGTQLYLEGGVFETSSSCKNIDPSYGGSPDVTVKDCSGNNLSNNSSTVSKPSYSYTALSASQVKSIITNSYGAGATLTVTTAGKVSSAGDGSNVTVTGVSVSPTSSTITTSGGTVQLSASVSPSNASNKSVTWSSSNTSVATVSSSGKVTAIANGSATITVKTSDAGKTASCSITVNINNSNLDGSIALSASASSSSINLSWSSSNISSSYQVYRDTDSNPSGRTRIGVTASKSYSDTNVSSGTTYYYWIKATDSNGSTVNSNAASANISGNTTENEVHNFTTSGKSSSFYSITGNLSTSKGTETFNGLTLTQCLKIESSTSISFTATQSGTLTLVFNSSFNGDIKVDGSSKTVSSGVLSVSLSAGNHTITKSASTNLYYMSYGDALKSATYSEGISEESSNFEFKLYPNPVESLVTIELTQEFAEGALIQIFDITGRSIINKFADGENQVLDLSTLKSGLYVVKVSNATESITKRIVKK